MRNLHDLVVRQPNVAALFLVQHSTAVERSARRALTDVAIKSAKPRDRSYRLYDTGGLYLELFPNGSKLWRWKYRFEGKEKRLAFGKYPEVGLKDAREKRDDARKLLRTGVDPSGNKQRLEAAKQFQAASTFGAVANDWYERMMSGMAESHRVKVKARLENDILPWLGQKPITDITAPDIAECLRRIVDRGARDTAHRALQNCAAVFRFAVVEGKARDNPAIHLKGALPPARPGHFAAITEPEQVGPLLRKMDAVSATFQVKCALRLAPYLFCRPGELRTMRWDEVHLDAAEWRFVASKNGPSHIVPLPLQAIAILRELYPLTGRGEFVFPGRDDRTRPMSNATLNRALQRAGISTREEQTGHGFRAMARTILHEGLRFAPEVIEHQLAHRVPDVLGRAYNRTRFLKDRTEMMQQWADYLDRLRDGVEPGVAAEPRLLIGPREGR
ncbi:tyrosine-type recombinase/integrase [Caballeronia zhejiangensis]|uniref:tyrosine-type recombinase/integrase n=1 Tax=Caballeronia zhejiangensis TaxID=871203 RepID=UPI001EF5B145|nr:integrase arm-type DNA-binding domain-containing protein [Caballeronia zhejiangensis]MCG7399706.1 integrase arm-type DNA-binding domain-containing protein [Caballeronia zhejiangensis]